jgi:hypothetical protein
VPVYQDLTLGVPICGEASVFVDGPTGGTYRDLDWYYSADVNAGGTFTFTVGTSGFDLLFGVLDLDSGAFVAGAGWVLPGGIEDSVTSPVIPAGNYSVIAAPNDWNTDWTCDSGLVEYFMLIE